jgi:hypothetical protein
MNLRRLVSLSLATLSLFLLAPAFAAELGKADGTVTINRKPVKLKYAFAKNEDGRTTVVLTDRAVSRTMLSDSTRYSKAVEKGEVIAVSFTFDEAGKLENTEVRSKALKTKAMPIMSSKVKMTGPKISDGEIDGAAKTTEDSEFFSDVATLDAKFHALLAGGGKFGDNPAAAKELAASGPKIADGGAAGTLKVDGATIKLTNSIARIKPNAFDEHKKDVVVLLTDKPVAAEVFADDRQLFKAVEKDGLRGILLTIDDEEKPYHMSILDPKASLQLSGSGIFNFDATDYSTTHVAGKFFTNGEEDFMGKHKYSYDVAFAVPVQVIAVASELTLDASNGTKLPPGGGEPGKAYAAFDKAARSGNMAEMKKFGGKNAEMPDLKPEEMKKMIELIKLMRPAKLKVIGGYANADHATLSVEGEDSTSKAKMKGTIEMEREGNSWKLLAEKWKQ